MYTNRLTKLINQARLIYCVFFMFGFATLKGQGPSITTQPNWRVSIDKTYPNAFVEDGHVDCELAISIVADGATGYQWKKNGTNVSASNRFEVRNGVSIDTSKTAYLVIKPSSIADVGTYTCVVTGVAGTTTSASLKVAAANLRQNITSTAVEGQATVLLGPVSAAAATSSDLSFKWYKVPNGISDDQIDDTYLIDPSDSKYSGATSASLTINTVSITDAEDNYRCEIIANNYGDLVEGSSTEYNNLAKLAGVRKLVVLTGPENTKYALVLSGASPTFSVDVGTATGQTFQWFKAADAGLETQLENGAKFANVTTKTLTVKSVSADTDAGIYFCKVTKGGQTLSAGYGNLVIIPAPISQLASIGGGVALTIVPAVANEATAGLLTYSWRKGTATTTLGTGVTYTIPNVTTADAGAYSCKVILSPPGGTPITLTSAPANVDVVGTSTGYALVLPDASPTLTVDVGTATGQTFQWFKAADAGLDTQLSDNAKFAGVTTKTLTVKLVSGDTDAGKYYCKVTKYGQTVSGGIRNLVIIPVPVSQLASIGGEAALTIEPAVADQFTARLLTYAWSKSTAATTTLNTDATYTISNVSTANAGAYSCKVTLSPPGGTPISVTSAAANVDVVGISSTYALVLSGANPTLTVDVGTATGQTFQWFKAVDAGLDTQLSDNTKFAGVTTKTLTVKLVSGDTDAGKYYCKVTKYGQIVSGGIRNLVIIPVPVSQLASIGGEAALTIEPAVADQFTASLLTYAWSKSTAATTTLNTDATYTISNVSTPNAGAYNCKVTLSPPGGTPITVTSAAANVDVVGTSAAYALVLSGANPTLTVDVGTATGQTFQWFKIADAGLDTQLSDNTKFAGVTTKTLTVKLVSGDTDAGRYYCKVTKYGQTVSGGNRVLSIVKAAQNTTALVGSPLALIQPVVLGQNDLTLTYLWKKGTSPLVPNQNSQILSLASCSLEASGTYSCAVSLGATTPLAFGSLTVTAPSVAVSVVENVPLVFNTKVSSASTKLSVNTSGTGLTYLWKKTDGSLTGPKYSGIATNTLTISPTSSGDLINYICTVNGYAGFTTDVSVRVEADPPTFGTIALPIGIVGGTYNYQIPAGPDVNVDSYASTALPAGLSVNSQTGVISGVPSVSGTKSLTFTITNGSGAATATATVNILPFPTAIAGDYNGPIARGAALNGELGGTFSMKITSTGAISGSIVSGSSASRAFTSTNATLTLPIDPSTGVLTGDPKVVISLPSTTALPSLAIELFLSRTASGSVQSTIMTDGKIVANSSTPVSFTGWRNKWSATAVANTSENATSYAGLYNVGLDLSLPSPLSGQPAKVPQGSGYLTFTVSTNGSYSVTGRASDGEAITSSAFIGPNGQLLIFDTIYSTTQKGSLLSSNLDATTPTNNLSIVSGVSNNVNRIQGQLTWNRPANTATTARLYKNGFGFGPNTAASTPDVPEPVMLTSFGGRYNPPLAATTGTNPLVLLGISAVTAPARNADLLFSENGVLPLITASRNPNIGISIVRGNTLTLPTGTTLNPASTTLSMVAATGQFSGQFTLNDVNPRGTPATISRTVQYKALLVPVTVSGQDPVYSSVGVGAFTIDLLPASGTTQTATTTSQQVGRVVLQKR